jgi:hypothetical protein
MSLSSYDTVERHVRGEGVDYGATGFLILTHGPLRLVWRPGSTIWAGIGHTAYSPACLQVEGHGSRALGGTELLSGGRLTEDRWLSVRKKISTLLSVPLELIPEMLPDRTIEIP